MPNIEEALRRIAHAKATHATTLDLSGLELEELPEELYYLGHLVDLDISNNKLVSLGNSLEYLNKLGTLNARSNKLATLPANIGQLQKLYSINLWNNKIVSLPATFENLYLLEHLDIGINQIKQLDDIFGELQNLKHISLSNNKLSSIPNSITKIRNLQYLNISYNNITYIPESINYLSFLRSLNINKNELEFIPDCLGDLIDLEYLDMSSNKISYIPETIGNLINLKGLSFTGNNVKNIPDSLGKLYNLKYLNAWNNEITDVPKTLGNLQNLQILSISRNNIKVLPDTIGKLNNLENLDVSRNKLRFLPDCFEDLDYHLIMLVLNSNKLCNLPNSIYYLTNLEILDIRNNEITHIPEGLGNLYKLQSLELSSNSLINLPNLSSIANIESITLANNPLNLPNEMIPIPSQEYQISIRQRTLAFLRQLWQGSRTLNEAKVILVGQGDVGKTSLVNRLIEDRFDPNEGKTNGIVIKQWQIQPHDAPIQLNLWDFGGQEIMHATHQFFLTKRSVYLLVLDARQDERANRVEYWLKIIASVASDAPVIIVGNQSDQHPLDLDERGLKLKYPQIKAIIPTSCKTGAGIQQVRHQIEQEIGAMKHVHDLVPLKWWDVKGEIEQWQSDFISHDRFEEICVKHGIADEFVQAVLLRLLNDLGTVLSYNDDPRLADTNVLKPEWVTNGVYTLLNHKPLLERKHGILNIKDVPKILNDSKRYPAHRCHYITEMMEKFELCFHLEGEHDRVLIPDLLPKDAPDTGDWDDALHFRYRYPILPTSIMSRFIVRSQQSIEDDLRWRTGVVLRSNEGNRAQIVSDVEAAQIDIRITGADAGRRRFLSAIRYTFEQIHNSMSGIKSEVKEYVPLPDHPDRLVDYAELLGLEEMGEDRYVDGVLRKRFDLQQLLDGYESPKERRANRIKGDYENQEIEHLRDLVDIKRDALRVLENQRAQFGELHVPHHVVTQIENLTNEIGYIEEVMRKRR